MKVEIQSVNFGVSDELSNCKIKMEREDQVIINLDSGKIKSTEYYCEDCGYTATWNQIDGMETIFDPKGEFYGPSEMV